MPDWWKSDWYPHTLCGVCSSLLGHSCGFADSILWSIALHTKGRWVGYECSQTINIWTCHHSVAWSPSHFQLFNVSLLKRKRGQYWGRWHHAWDIVKGTHDVMFFYQVINLLFKADYYRKLCLIIKSLSHIGKHWCPAFNFKVLLFNIFKAVCG